MPRGDGTGPMGAGPLTGRGMGGCSRGGMFMPRQRFFGGQQRFSRRRFFQDFNNYENLEEEVLLEEKAFLEKQLALINEKLKK